MVSLYKDKEEWKDVTPIPQDDGPHPVVRIAYSERFKDVFDYFRAIIKSDEKSERALQLTTDAAELNPANYSVWQYRRLILKALNKDLQEELDFIKEIIQENPKNYQVWHHRKILVEWTQDPSDELEFSEEILHLDAKNYHAWSHRQWILETFKLWDGELAFVDKLLLQDLRNNSAWNQRYFVISNVSKIESDVLKREVEYTLEKIQKAPNNESPWNYLRGILSDHEMYKYPGLMDTCQEMYNKDIRSPYLIACIIDMYEEMLEAKTSQDDTLMKAVQHCNELADQYDEIRKEYWRYVERSLVCRFGTSKDE
ncbi:protein farnesyltransferase/geranylgeranyltransferase type-1 subunit alpha-like [Anneissia japonica]|uniref:protein farnesyltransferase/geranylgeranyltransferase type-1 subunit alpha-like n=1 Tax=Anneissia japonica TaxID=1529436 RepID=UPI001425AB40|nr:protein farnesyltransferase/geranylgeranyltransferase type-1 subunit alpha-like [Anneissia japonica]